VVGLWVGLAKAHGQAHANPTNPTRSVGLEEKGMKGLRQWKSEMPTPRKATSFAR